jgi:hypothetical protein
MDWLISSMGAAVITVALHDIFHTVWHPSGRGRVGRLVTIVVWRSSRRLKPHRAGAALAGPLATGAVVGTWTVRVVLGWTLVYWPHTPESFVLETGLDPARGGLPDALYLSLVTVTTLGFGDIVPAPTPPSTAPAHH